MCFNTKTKKVVFSKTNYWETKHLVSMCGALPVSHMLYSLMCMFRCSVDVNGPDGYKVVASIPLRHKETGQIIIFREWKAGFALGCNGMFEPQTQKDVCALLTLMINGQVLHPYDGTFAGSVA